jgi:shikimate dehydrogenase
VLRAAADAVEPPPPPGDRDLAAGGGAGRREPARLEMIAAGVQRFLATEIAGAATPDAPVEAERPAVGVAAIGTTAATAVHGELLSQALAAAGLRLASAEAYGGPEELLASRQWHLGLVLSPFKRDVSGECDALSPSAAATGVVDTVVRGARGVIGFNTNTWAARSALEVLTGGAVPASVLLLGAGASARSVALAVTRAWPGCELVVAARSGAAATELAARFGAGILDQRRTGGTDRSSWDVIVNTTTWGETEASESQPFGIDLSGVLAPGRRLFDLNNRISSLQQDALRSGCAVVSGAAMQRVTNACRAALASLRLSGALP